MHPAPRTPASGDRFQPSPVEVPVSPVDRLALGTVGGLVGSGAGFVAGRLLHPLAGLAASVAGLALGGWAGAALGELSARSTAVHAALGAEFDASEPPLVLSVRGESLADQAGVRPGDRLVRVGPHDLGEVGGIPSSSYDDGPVEDPMGQRVAQTVADYPGACPAFVRRGGRLVATPFPPVLLT